MMNLLISLLVFALIFGGALAGMAVRPLLSEHHLHSDSKDVVKLTSGLIARSFWFWSWMIPSRDSWGFQARYCGVHFCR
jgi:hypothetical protein